MRSRRRLVLIPTLLLLVLALVTVLLLRRELAAHGLRSVLARQGLATEGPGSLRFEVREVGLTRARLAVSAPAGAIDDLELSYSPLDLLRTGRLAGVVARGLVLRLDLTASDAMPFAGQATPAPAREAAFAALGEIRIERGRLELEARDWRLPVALEGSIRGTPRGVLEAQLDLAIAGSWGRLRGTAGLVVDKDLALAGRLRTGDAELRHPLAELTRIAGEADFSWRSGRIERLTARLLEGDLRIQGAPPLPLDLALTLENGGLEAEAGLGGGDRSLRARLHGAILPGEATARLEIDADLGPASPLLLLAGLPRPGAGRARVQLEADTRIPAASTLDASDLAAMAGSLARDIAICLRLEADGVAFPGRVAGLNVAVDLSGRLLGDTLHLEPQAGGRLDAASLAPAWLEELGLPPTLAAALGHGVTVLISGAATERAALGAPGRRARGPRPEVALAAAIVLGLDSGLRPAAVALPAFRLRATGVDLAFARRLELAAEGSLTAHATGFEGPIRLAAGIGDLRLEPLHAGDVTLEAALDWKLADGKLGLRLRSPARVAAASLGFGAALAVMAPVRADIQRGQLSLAGEHGGITVAHTLEAQVEPVELRVGSGERALHIRAELPDLRSQGILTPGTDYQGRLGVTGASLQSSEHDLALSGLSCEATPGASDGTLARFTGRLEDSGEPVRIASFGLAGSFRRDGDTLELAAEARLPRRPATPLALAGRHDLVSGAGELRLVTGPLAFSPGLLQPRDLLPALGLLRQVEGSARLEAQVAWHGGGVETDGRLSIENVALRHGALSVTGLSSDVVLESLFPAVSAPDQELSADRVEAGLGLPLEQVRARFALAPGPVLLVADAEARVAGGRLAVAGLVLDPRAATRALTLRFERLDLARLLEAIDVDGLEGEGWLTGEVPLELGGDRLVIAGGTLAATAPGVLRYRSEGARQALAPGGEPVTLMLRALEDFHYRVLTVTLARSEGDEARLGAVLEGSNPEVLGGYPFRINLEVEGDASSLLAALSEAYRLKQQLFRRLGARE